MFEALWKLLLRDKTNVYVFTVLRFEILQMPETSLNGISVGPDSLLYLSKLILVRKL